MKYFVPILFLFTFALPVLAQADPPAVAPPPPPPPESSIRRVVGKAKVYFFTPPDRTFVTVSTFLLRDAAALYLRRDAISLSMGFWVMGKKATEPKILDLALTTYTFNVRSLKYHDNHKLTIRVDGKQVISSDTVEEFSDFDEGVAFEGFELKGIKYEDFLKIIKGKLIMFQLGETEMFLSQDAIQALNDLNNTIER